MKGAALPFEKTGKAARRTGVAASAAASALGGGRHERRVEGAGDVEAPRAGAGLLARDLLGRVERVERPGQHELARGVVVGDGEAEARGQRARRRRASPPSRASMPPGLRAARVGHGRAALGDEADGVVEGDRAGRDERRVLAERVAGGGDESPARPRRRRPRAAASHAATEQRKSAGCCVRVPSPRRANGSKPSSSSPRSKSGMAAVRRVHALGVAPLTGEEQCAGRHRDIPPMGPATFPFLDTRGRI